MIVAFLHRFQATHSIRVTHATGAAYQIDLVICFNILSKIHRQFQLFDLFDEKGIKASPEAWLDAVIEVGETETEAVSQVSIRQDFIEAEQSKATVSPVQCDAIPCGLRVRFAR